MIVSVLEMKFRRNNNTLTKKKKKKRKQRNDFSLLTNKRAIIMFCINNHCIMYSTFYSDIENENLYNMMSILSM